MRHSTSIATVNVLLAWAAMPCLSHAQPTVPVFALPSATASSAETFGAIVSVRALSNGKVLVNDAGHRQVKLLMPNLATSTVVLDSVNGAANGYGVALPLIAYLGDSTLFPDIKSRTMSELDGGGAVARSFAMPRASDLLNLRTGAADRNGRVIYPAAQLVNRTTDKPTTPTIADSVPLLRADFEKRTTDTVAYFTRPMARTDAVGPTGGIYSFWNPDLLRSIDEWAVLTDGSIALVRGHDYHIDFIRTDGTEYSSAKIPIDVRKLSDDDKVKMIDSAQAQWVVAARNNTLVSAALHSPTPWALTGPKQEYGKGTSVRPQFDTTGAELSTNSLIGQLTVYKPQRPSVDHVFDYYPPIRSGAVLADLDNQLWILPTTSKQSKAGELVYDVVNSKGELVKRVRVPLGRLIVGFGPNGAVYVASGGLKNGFTLERTTMPAKSESARE